MQKSPRWLWLAVSLAGSAGWLLLGCAREGVAMEAAPPASPQRSAALLERALDRLDPPPGERSRLATGAARPEGAEAALRVVQAIAIGTRRGRRRRVPAPARRLASAERRAGPARRCSLCAEAPPATLPAAPRLGV